MGNEVVAAIVVAVGLSAGVCAAALWVALRWVRRRHDGGGRLL